MAKISRNAPCPCGSGKKYKRCCLLKQSSEDPKQEEPFASAGDLMADYGALETLSNQVPALIRKGRLDEAEKVCQELLKLYPDQIDGIDRMAAVYEARDDYKKAAEYYRKAAAFAESNPGFGQEGIVWYLDNANRLEKTTPKK
jgi:tetratricopeptide (TPR) repeat protein